MSLHAMVKVCANGVWSDNFCVADNPRIEELRGRVKSDPASIAFAQLAEEYRRSGDFQEAIRICRACPPAAAGHRQRWAETNTQS